MKELDWRKEKVIKEEEKEEEMACLC